MKQYIVNNQIVTASSKKEAVVLASRENRPFGSIYLHKNDHAGESKPEFFYVIVNENGKFLKTQSNKFNHDLVGFTKNINEADLMGSSILASKICKEVEDYNPKFKLSVKKVKLSM